MRAWRIVVAVGSGVLPGMVRGQAVALDRVVVSATRFAEDASTLPLATTTITGAELRSTPTTTLDAALRSQPEFSLFRRSDSLTANPTTQGVSLRGLGPSGASRSLVLLDGVPLNDPFGGWVAWTKVPRETLARAEIVPGGGATAWGNAALGGVVQLVTEAPTAGRGRFGGFVGDFSTRSAELSVGVPAGAGAVQVSAREFASDGYYVVAPEHRGPIDARATNRHRWALVKIAQPIGAALDVSVTLRSFEETRANGTAYQRNATRENFGSVMVRGRPSAALSWEATAYAQAQNFSQTFSAVDATRSTETPASEQFGVPATALGAAWIGRWTNAGGQRVSFGVDARSVRGETRERYSFVGGDFTRERFAGGGQSFAGAFILDEFTWGDAWTWSVGLRVDRWVERDGHLREIDRTTGAVSRNDAFGERSGWALGPSAGVVWRAGPGVRVRASAQHAFRRPTLNELYRPFRVGSTLTAANAALRTERATSAEVGVDVTRNAWTLRVTAFRTELRDAVSNVTVAHGPANVPEIGVIPAGGIGRQRLNLERVEVSGIEPTLAWQPSVAWTWRLAYLFNATEVRRASVAPALEGRQLAEVPRHSASAGAEWRSGRWVMTGRARWIGAQFDDDENQLRLAPVVVGDVAVSVTLSRRWTWFGQAENIGDARIETGRSASGVVNTGTPRFLSTGLRAAW